MTLRTGNFHALVLYQDEAELALVREAVNRINRKAIELEGTCTSFSSEWFDFPLPYTVNKVPENTALVQESAITSCLNWGRAL
jgi:hypothetical protein